MWGMLHRRLTVALRGVSRPPDRTCRALFGRRVLFASRCWSSANLDEPFGDTSELVDGAHHLDPGAYFFVEGHVAGA
jgi:hypothetical protein